MGWVGLDLVIGEVVEVMVIEVVEGVAGLKRWSPRKGGKGNTVS